VENIDVNINVIKFWNELPQDDRHKLLSENHFWDGLSHYLFEFLPDDLKSIIRLKIEDNNN